MRITVNIPDRLLGRAKREAARRGTTLCEVVVDALQANLSRPSRSESPKQFGLITFGGAAAWPDADFDRSSELLAAEDEVLYRIGEAPKAHGRKAKASKSGVPAP